jgi:hypothetical protein
MLGYAKPPPNLREKRDRSWQPLRGIALCGIALCGIAILRDKIIESAIKQLIKEDKVIE